MTPSRILWAAVGLVFVGVGGIGVVVPGLPTTVFFILAAWCFSHSSQRLEAWVLALPGVGPMVNDYRNGLGMPRRAKVIAITSIIVFVSISAFLLIDAIAIKALVITAGLVGVAYVGWRVPTRENVLAPTS